MKVAALAFCLLGCGGIGVFDGPDEVAVHPDGSGGSASEAGPGPLDETLCRTMVAVLEHRGICTGEGSRGAFDECMTRQQISALNRSLDEWRALTLCTAYGSESCSSSLHGCHAEWIAWDEATHEGCHDETVPGEWVCTWCGYWFDPPETWICPCEVFGSEKPSNWPCRD